MVEKKLRQHKKLIRQNPKNRTWKCLCGLHEGLSERDSKEDRHVKFQFQALRLAWRESYEPKTVLEEGTGGGDVKLSRNCLNIYAPCHRSLSPPKFTKVTALVNSAFIICKQEQLKLNNITLFFNNTKILLFLKIKGKITFWICLQIMCLNEN